MEEQEEQEESVEYNIEVKDDDNFLTILNTWKNIQSIKKNLLMNEDKIKNRIKIFLKEKHWDKYIDPATKISMSLIKGHSETFDKKQLKFMLTEAQYTQAIKVTNYEKLIILTSEDRNRLKKQISPKKIGGGV